MEKDVEGRSGMACLEPARDRIALFVSACDPLSRDGVASQLRGHGVELVDERDLGPDTVAVVVVDEMDPQAAAGVRSLRRRGVEHVVVVAARLDDAGLLAAAEAGACGVLRRGQTTPQRLLASIRAAAAGEGSLPPDLLGRLLGQVGRLQRQVLAPRGLTFSGLTDREVRVLRLLADGLDTAEVGRQLFLSERTVKNVVHDLTSRLNLRNRTHAVAYALRQGLI
ncbi:MAG TPA: response regulator transcription factor [Candidatus Dormibacteraeota bacterium]|nr:response regulator transcription factor [Candidatus Dormibacteraeota bacterium]